MLQTKYIVIAIVVVALLGAGLYFATKEPSEVAVVENDASMQEGNSVNSPTVYSNDIASNPVSLENDKQVPVIVTHSEYAFDVGNTKELAGWATNIFIGKVVAQAGEKPRTRVPQTQYSVEVLSNIKGNPTGRIMVNQSGVGYAEGKLFVNEGDLVLPTDKEANPDDVFLKEGGTYLFATGFDSKENWYTISAPPYDRELITTDDSYNDTQLRALADQNPRVQEFKAAIAKSN